MATPDEVIQANTHAKRSKLIDDVTFDSLSQSGFFVTFGGNRILEFDSMQDANSFKDQLNNALVSTKSSLTTYYQQKIDGIV